MRPDPDNAANQARAHRPGEPIYSQFHHDPDMVELITMFVEELPERARVLREAHAASDLETLVTLAHQLKGAGGGYGFPAITEAGAQVVARIQASEPTDAPALRMDQVQQDLQELIDLCQRAVARPPME